ncbi:MAG: diaminopimelate epimerase [Legionellaceae bacterium]|nr:diaminopimelate epimerase [Legionellaceae bacterium]
MHFSKMHGLGNDFMIIDGVRQSIQPTSSQITSWGRRDTGIGFDQCLLIEPSRAPDVDFFYRIFNANGHEVGQCGNGARCLARFVERYGLTDKKTICVATHTTRMQLDILPDETVTVDMGKPQLLPSAIPIKARTQKPWYSIPLPNHTLCDVHAISVGNPHAVLVVEDVSQAQVASLGKLICEHPLFPEQTNVGFMHIINPEHIDLRVYERGCGETRACGSGAVAAVAVGRLFHNLSNQVTVTVPGGNLLVKWPNMLDGHIVLNGPAVFVYEGILEDVCVL